MTELPNIGDKPADLVATWNTEIEAEIATQAFARGFDAEFDFYQKAFDAVAAEYDDQVAAAKTSKETRIFASLLCSSAVVLDPSMVRTPCLSLDEALDARLTEQFFLSLAPGTIEIFTDQIEKPWSQPIDKATALIQKYSQELATRGEVIAGLEQKWSRLRHIVWRWASMQMMGDAFASCSDPNAASVFDGKI